MTQATRKTENVDSMESFWKAESPKNRRQDHPCLWMKAGAVTKKFCNNFYDCSTCRYDDAMNRQVALGRQLSWQDAMRRKESMARVCRHSLTGRIGQRVCPHNYACSTCTFDQYFEEVLSAKIPAHARGTVLVKGFDVPYGHYFHNGHTWARIESGGMIRIGVDDFSQKVFGRADAYDLPLTGQELNPDRIGWGLKRGDNTADVLSPIGGVIVEINPDVRRNPGLVNTSPYEDGWLLCVYTRDVKGAFKSLMEDTQSVAWMENEVHALEALVEDVAGPLAADGGTFHQDIFGNLPGLDWNRLTRTFLRT